MSDFNIMTELERAVREDDRDPRDVAELVAYEVPDSELRAALAHALRLLAHGVASKQRVRSVAAVGAPTASRWVASSSTYQSFLAKQVKVEGDKYKAMRDCTASDLLFVASERRKHAHKVLKQASWFEDLAKTLDKAGVDTVGDLSNEELEKLAA